MAENDFLICPCCGKDFKGQERARSFWADCESVFTEAMRADVNTFPDKALGKTRYVCDVCRAVLYLGGAVEYEGKARFVRMGWVTEMFMEGGVIKSKKQEFEKVAL